MAQRTAAPVAQPNPQASFRRSLTQSDRGGRGRDAGSRRGRGTGSVGRHHSRGRGGQPGRWQGALPPDMRAAAGADMDSMSRPHWRAHQQQQVWNTSPQQLSAFGTAPTVSSQQQQAFSRPGVVAPQMQFGGVQQLPDGSFVLPVSQQIVLTPQQMDQLSRTGQLPSVLLQQGLQPSAPAGPQHFSTQQFGAQFAGYPTVSQSFQQQQQHTAQQLVGPYSAARPPLQPPRPPQAPPRSLYQSGV